MPLAPGETVNISHKEWAVTEQEFEDIVQDYFEGYSEQGVADKTDVAMSNDSQSQHSTALNLGASLSASYSTVTLSTTFGYNSASNDSQSKKDSRNHSMDITKKASARTKKDHKITFKVTSVTGSEDQSVRVISNPSTTDAMRIDYFQLARKWKMDLLRYGLRMTYDIVIPNPGSGIFTLVDEVATLDAAHQHAVLVHVAAVGDLLQLAGHRSARHIQLRPARRAVQRLGDPSAGGSQVGQRP